MQVKMAWQGLKERAEALRLTAGELRGRASRRTEELPGLALAAQEQRDGGVRAFDEACAEADRLLAEARRAQFAAAALDEKAEEARAADAEYERCARVGEMSDERAAYDYAVGEMDKALKDVEDAHRVLRDQTADYAGALRRAGLAEQASTLQRRASQMLAGSLWANAPGLAKALGVERRFFHRRKDMADAAGFLPAKNEEEQR